MIKTFTIHSSYQQEISPGKGSIIWLLSDEKKRPRKIAAITDVDKQNNIVGMQAVYKREKPLVERLQELVKGDSFTIDFSDYNEQENYTPREMYDTMRLQEKTAQLGSNFTKIAILLGVLAAIWFAYHALSDVSELRHNFM